MRLKATDPEAANVAVVKVDGKIVKFPIELDTDEGWCLANMPLPPPVVEEIQNPDPEDDNPLDAGDARWVQVKLTGKVEVIFDEDS